MLAESTDAVQDPFALLDLPRGFALDEAALDRALLRASLAWHPDRFALRPESERLAAEDRMAELNDAHRRLADPVERAEVLLELAGLPMDEGTDASSSPEFLMEMMELKEEVDDARRGGSAVVLTRLREQFLGREAEEIAALGASFEALPDDVSTAPAAPMAELRAHLNQIAYLRRTRREVDQALLMDRSTDQP